MFILKTQNNDFHSVYRPDAATILELAPLNGHRNRLLSSSSEQLRPLGALVLTRGETLLLLQVMELFGTEHFSEGFQTEPQL